MMHEFILNNMLKDCQPKNDEISHETYIPEPSRHFNSLCYDDEESTISLNEITSQIPPSIAITPVLPTMEPEDSLIMGDENLSTIPEKESDEFIKSSVENLVPILSESEDTSDNDSECDLPFCDKSVIFSNPLFNANNDFTSSDDESLAEEDVIENKESYVSNLDEPVLLVTPLSDANKDECFDPGGEFDEIEACLTSDSIPPGIDGADFDPEGDILLLEKLLNDDISFPLPPKELHFEGLNIPPDSKEFLDHDPRSLKDEPDNDDSKSMVKVFDPEIHEKISSPTYVRLPVTPPDRAWTEYVSGGVTSSYFEHKDFPDYEDSRARGFVHSIVHSSFNPLHAYIWESDILDLID
ncbi:hypothetical protein Tco_0397967 [Tanacetum coccineum]